MTYNKGKSKRGWLKKTADGDKTMKLGLRNKIILMIIVISMTITTILSIAAYSQAAELIQENYSSAAVRELQVCADVFDHTMRDAYYACVYATNDETVKETLRNQDASQLQALLEDYRKMNSSIDCIGCYRPDQNEIVRVDATGTSVLSCDEAMGQWLQGLLPDENQNQFAPIYRQDQSSMIDKRLFLYSREMKESNGDVLGQIFVGVDERTMFFQCLQNSAVNGDGERYIVNGDEIVSAVDIDRLGTDLSLKNSGLIITDVEMSMTGYHIISSADASSITDDLVAVGRNLLVVTLLLNLLACIPVFLTMRRMLHPVEELKESMERVSGGDLKARAVVYEPDEIGQLSAGFNDMVSQIEHLIQELVTQKMLKKEAEIEALQYQITPHFMYNTLNSIKYAAILQDSKDIADLLESFIELLQISASDRGAFITVKQEMHMVQNYVKLQQFRYADSFTVQIDVQPETESCYVPCLLIQPLVENAILHGINHKRQKNQISISVMRNTDMLNIKIEDHGEGMTAEDIQKLMDGHRKSKFSGIGVRNIRERLQLYYGPNAELRFFSRKGMGTTALITLPVSFNENEYTI